LRARHKFLFALLGLCPLCPLCLLLGLGGFFVGVFNGVIKVTKEPSGMLNAIGRQLVFFAVSTTPILVGHNYS
jgi:hypothetical protein